MLPSGVRNSNTLIMSNIKIHPAGGQRRIHDRTMTPSCDWSTSRGRGANLWHPDLFIILPGRASGRAKWMLVTPIIRRGVSTCCDSSSWLPNYSLQRRLLQGRTGWKGSYPAHLWFHHGVGGCRERWAGSVWLQVDEDPLPCRFKRLIRRKLKHNHS